jgi:hypothetical protein
MNTNEQKPDAPQEVPDDNKFSSNPHNHGMVPTGEVAGMPGMAEWSPTPSKETIAKETANEATRALFPHLFTGLSDDTVELVRWQSRLEPIILRAIDRAGEAKGADE